MPADDNFLTYVKSPRRRPTEGPAVGSIGAKPVRVEAPVARPRAGTLTAQSPPTD